MADGRKRKAVEPKAPQEDEAKADEMRPGFSQDEEAGPSTLDQADIPLHVNPKRYRELRAGEIKKGPVIYW